MYIRKSTMEDLSRMEEIFAYAREQMKKNGNPNQWGNHKPARETLMEDIKNGKIIISIIENKNLLHSPHS